MLWTGLSCIFSVKSTKTAALGYGFSCSIVPDNEKELYFQTILCTKDQDEIKVHIARSFLNLRFLLDWLVHRFKSFGNSFNLHDHMMPNGNGAYAN